MQEDAMNVLYKSIFLFGGIFILYSVFHSIKNKKMSKLIFGPISGPQKRIGVYGYVVLALNLLLAAFMLFFAYHV